MHARHDQEAAGDLAAAVAQVLAAAGLREAPRRPGGHPAGDGYAVERMTQCGPDRVAVRWHHASPCPGCPGLDLCRIALATAGYRVEPVCAPAPYLAVLPPPERKPPSMTETTTPGQAAEPARSPVYVCQNPLCGSVASYPGTCCGLPMAAR